MAFSNPVPVAVALIPYKDKLVAIRRGIEPKKGMIALPGGYIHTGETFSQALSREALEETGIDIHPDAWQLFHIGDSLQSNRLLIFGLCKDIGAVDLNFTSEETLEVLLVDSTSALAFPLHDDAKNKFFAV